MFSIGSPKRTTRLFPTSPGTKRTLGSRPKPLFRPQVEMLEGRSLPSTASLSLSVPLIGPLAAVSSQPATASVVVVETAQLTVSLAPSAAESRASAFDDHAAESPFHAMTFQETTFAVELVFQQTLVVVPTRDLPIQTPVDQIPQALAITPVSESIGQTAVGAVSLMDSVVPEIATVPQSTGTLSASTNGGASASFTSTAVASAQPRGAISPLTPALLGLGALPPVNTTMAAIIVPNYIQVNSQPLPVPTTIGTLSAPDLGAQAQLWSSQGAAGPVLPASDARPDNRDEPGMALPPPVNAPAPDNAEPPAANDEGANLGDDSDSSRTATVDQADPETPLVVLGNEGVARVPELAAAVAVFTAGMGLFPATLPTDLDTQTPRRRRSA